VTESLPPAPPADAGRAGANPPADASRAGANPPAYAYQPPRPFNTYAIIAIIMACFVLPPLGIYFGHLAKRQIAETGEQGAELAHAAIIVGWVFTVLMGVMLLFFCGLFFVWLGLFSAVASTEISGPTINSFFGLM
jgi:hypothetical protein